MTEPSPSPSEAQLRAHVERVLSEQYELEREIGRGGMGIVYRARDRRLKRHIAVKLLPPELAFRSEIRTRFLREAETAAQLSHPNIVPIYSVGEQENLVFFVMAYVDGVNLARRILDQGRLDHEETRRILCEVSDALAYAHVRGVIHRDIKPDNILLDRETGRAMVTDFGIARAGETGDTRLTATGMAIGTPAFMSPEQCAGEREIDGRSDLYSLGVVGYQMLSGELPFKASNTPALLVKHLSERPVAVEQRRHDTPPDLARAIMMLLEKEPENRFPDATALQHALQGGVVPTPPSQRASRLSGATARGEEPGERLPALGPARRPLPAAETEGEYAPSREDLKRWNAEPVEQFRRKVAPYIAVNLVILVAAIVTNMNLLTATMFWTMYMAYKYAKLWTEGYDWRDVFRQPRDRELVDVTSEAIEDVQAIFDRERRDKRRERRRHRRLQGSSTSDTPPTPTTPTGATPSASGARRLPAGNVPGPHAATVRQAAANREEIAQLVANMPKHERERIAEVLPSADALFDRVEGLAIALTDIERQTAGESLADVEREVAKLEAEANPLDRERSETRVRRLAQLRRQRRALIDRDQRRREMAAKLESCALSLQNVRLDLLRLRAGAESHEHVTSLALRALALAREVDHHVKAADEVGTLVGRGAEDRRMPPAAGGYSSGA